VTDLVAIERDLTAAYRVRLAGRRRRRRIARTVTAAALAAGALAAVAVASDVGVDLQLDPTKWIVLGSGTTDSGRGSYVHAKRVADGSPSTFMVEHDAGLAPYAAFRLHETTRAAADATSPVSVTAEPGPLCTPAQLTRAEVVALDALAPVAASTGPDAAKPTVDAALARDFAEAPCRGLEYAGEQARLVWAGVEPRALLMPGAR
jgi:hypothetical protein